MQVVRCVYQCEGCFKSLAAELDVCYVTYICAHAAHDAERCNACLHRCDCGWVLCVQCNTSYHGAWLTGPARVQVKGFCQNGCTRWDGIYLRRHGVDLHSGSMRLQGR
jgi:hypothetical protein